MADTPRYCQSCGNEVHKSHVYDPVDTITKRPVYDKTKESEPHVMRQVWPGVIGGGPSSLRE